MDTSRHLRLLTEDMRQRLQKPLLTSRVSTATDSLPGSSLNNSRSRIDKSAERIATYVTVYGRKSTERSGRSSRSSFRTHRNEESSIETRPVTRSNAPIAGAPPPGRDKPHGNIRALNKQADILQEEVSLAKSDRLELFRDLATFECRFAKKVGLDRTLGEIRNKAEGLPYVMDVLTQVSSETETTLSRLKSNLHILSSLRPSVPSASTLRFRKSNASLRSISTRHHIQSQYRGCVTISGLKSFVQVFADSALEHFRVQVQTLTGLAFSLGFTHTLRQDLPPKVAIQQRLIPYLHFISQGGRLQLRFDQAIGGSFTTIITKLRGLIGLHCLVLIQDEDSVRVRSEDFDCFVSVPTGAFTEKGSVYEMTYQEVQAVLERNLTGRSNPGQLWWLEERNSLFSGKERQSKLMDPEYLSEALGNFVHVLMARDEVIIDNEPFTIEIYAHRSIEKVKITHFEYSIELDSSSPLLLFLKSLQFSLLQKQPKTIARSLELNFCIKAMFLHNNSQLL